jgi:ABC-2 type transport system ATP-binding protein
LKATAGGARIDVVIVEAARLAEAARILQRVTGAVAHVEMDVRHVTAPVNSGAAALADVVRALDAADIAIDDIALRRPTLDEVFLRLTGREANDSPDESAESEVA